MPQEAWSERKPESLEALHMCHIPSERRSKLDDKSEKYILIGYDSNTKGYKLHNLDTGKTILSRDAVFDEEG